MCQHQDAVSQVADMERRFWAAAGDPQFYEAHFAEDGRIALAMGILDKAESVESMRAAAAWSNVALRDVQATRITDDVVSMTYRAKARRDDEPEYTAVVSSVYVRRNGAWKLVLHQQTPAV